MGVEFGVACSKAARGYGNIYGLQLQKSEAVVAEASHTDLLSGWVASVEWASGRSLQPSGGVMAFVPHPFTAASAVRLWLPVRRGWRAPKDPDARATRG
jgi:hypothetical protein